MSGQRGDLFTWLRAQEVAQERLLSFEADDHRNTADTPSTQADAQDSSSLEWHFEENEDDVGGTNG
ncbi:hypothetical protein MTX20_26370 [Bradyrhizobium sp. ISRA435]|nr:hypothetical protein MTX20_26370 [Bradyrhizobium sp. ISRA435]